jgi:hypothetical protein
MIGNGRLSEADYYRALAHARGVPSRAEIGPHELTAPGSFTRPRQCLAHGSMKERGAGRRLCLRAGRLRPNALMQVLGGLAPQLISLAAPQALRKAVCGHFAPALATSALVGAPLFPDAEYAVPSGHLLPTPFSPSEIHEMLHVMQPQRR